MEKEKSLMNRSVNRRSLLKTGALAGGAVAIGAGLVGTATSAFADESKSRVTRGDIDILKFLSALEQVEADLWIQYAELGGATNQGLSPIDLPFKTGLAPDYITGLLVLDGDMPQYIADNTDDEISHHRFLNNYLQSKGAKPIDLSSFAILPPSQVTGVPQNGRLTNLKQLTIDTSWWTRNRSENMNPDLGGKFENAVPDLAKGQHPAIPVSDADLGVDPKSGNISNHLQAIANTAGFHFAFIEQGGSSLYPALAQNVTDLEVLRVLLSIGGSEIMHFQTWSDKAGNATNITDGALTFPNLNIGVDPNVPPQLTGNAAADAFQTNLIMPEPTVFLDPKLGPVAILRPTSIAQGGAVASVVSFAQDGLFLDPSTGQNTGIVDVLMRLAEAADEARRGF
jgi:Ferritin-like domain